MTMAVTADRKTYAKSADFRSNDRGEQVRCGFILDLLVLLRGELGVLRYRRGIRDVKYCQYDAWDSAGVFLPESRCEDGPSSASSLLVQISRDESPVVSRLNSYCSSSKSNFADMVCLVQKDRGRYLLTRGHGTLEQKVVKPLDAENEYEVHRNLFRTYDAVVNVCGEMVVRRRGQRGCASA